MWVKLLSLNPYSTGIWSATGGLFDYNDINKIVLILILLEYGLRQALYEVVEPSYFRLNPYSTGIWSATKNKNYIDFKISSGLNPYSTGIWSATVNTLPSWLC